MFIKKLELFFAGLIFIAVGFLLYNYLSAHSFKNSELPQSYKNKIAQKEQEVLENMQRNFGFVFQVPLIVTDEFKGRLYGLTAYQNGKIKIYLNKKVMRESMDYMVNSVIAHEYAHALMFKLNGANIQGDGHSAQWQEICFKLGGEDCQRYVNKQEIIMSKMPF